MNGVFGGWSRAARRYALPALAAVGLAVGASGCFYRKTVARSLDRYEKHVETFVEKMPDFNDSEGR